MQPSYISTVVRKKQLADRQAREKALISRQEAASSDSAERITRSIASEGNTNRAHTYKVRLTNEDLAKSADIRNLAAGVTALRKATEDKSQAWDGVVDTLRGTLSATIGAIEQLDSDVANKNAEVFTGAVAELKQVLASLHEIRVQTDADIRQGLEAIVAAIDKQDMAPVIKVPQPKITVQERPIDFAPLQETIREAMTPLPSEPPRINLDDYRAQDIKDGKDTQYLGFLNPQGDWYIIENKVKQNRLRYLFGHGDYAKHFANAARYEYELLDEAINAL